MIIELVSQEGIQVSRSEMASIRAHVAEALHVVRGLVIALTEVQTLVYLFVGLFHLSVY